MKLGYDEPLSLEMPFEEALERFARVNVRDLVECEEGGPGAQPFVKWVGGKRSIIHELVSRAPQEFGDYWEPFVGGGALFFELYPGLSVAHLSDSNFDLVMTYKVIQKDPEKLLALLEKHAAAHSEAYYYKVRSQHDLNDPIAIAARFLYLNKTCYNGLYRVNRKGEFNVPVGRYTNPGIVQRENIMACSKALEHARIEYRDFTEITPAAGDFVYFDPPYHPTDDTSFTSYTKSDFTEKDQRILADFALELHRKGVKVMLSNSHTRFITDLYSNPAFKTETVQAPRMVNCKPQGRASVDEVVVTNYGNA